jgi:hypothetical protein
MKQILQYVLVFLCLCTASITAQTVSNPPNAISVWTVHTFEMGYPPNEQRNSYIFGVLTPEKAITIRRIEAISGSGPRYAPPLHGMQDPPPEPIPCPSQYSIEITSGVMSQTVPVSNVFIEKKSSQTFTDSGPLNLSFAPQSRITVSVIAPKPTFPSVHCSLSGLDISIQYEPTETQPK